MGLLGTNLKNKELVKIKDLTMAALKEAQKKYDEADEFLKNSHKVDVRSRPDFGLLYQTDVDHAKQLKDEAKQHLKTVLAEIVNSIN
jgi:hypothetical protein